MSEVTHIIDLPKCLVDDHIDRMIGPAEIVAKRLSKSVRLEATREQLITLADDAIARADELAADDAKAHRGLIRVAHNTAAKVIDFLGELPPERDRVTIEEGTGINETFPVSESRPIAVVGAPGTKRVTRWSSLTAVAEWADGNLDQGDLVAVDTTTTVVSRIHVGAA